MSTALPWPQATSALRICAVPALLLSLVVLTGCQSTRTNAPAVAQQPDQAVVWHELLTPDAELSRRFLTEVMGWNLTTPKGGYSPIYDDQARLVGGMIDTEAMGWSLSRGGWLLSVQTPDIEAALQRVRDQGGVVLQEPVLLHDRGRIALVQDPQGAVMEVVELMRVPDPEPMSPNLWTWHELITDNPASAATWYATVFGLQRASLPGGRQQLLKNGQAIATISVNPFEEKRNQWIPVVGVENLDDTLDSVSSWGGRVALRHRSETTGARLALIQDPSGAAMLLQEQEKTP